MNVENGSESMIRSEEKNFLLEINLIQKYKLLTYLYLWCFVIGLGPTKYIK